MYKQTAEHIKNMIRFGYYPPGARISERKLAEEYNVSRSTIKEALELLKLDGLLETMPRSGTIVARNAWNRLIDSRTPDWPSLAKSGVHVANRKLMWELSREMMRSDTTVLFRYGIIEEPFHPYEPVTKAMEKFSLINGYTDHINNHCDQRGLPLLRKELAKHLKVYGINASADNILIFKNYSEATNIIHQALLRPGMNYYTMADDMVASMGTIQTIGLNYYPVAYDGEGLEPEDLLRKVNRKNMNILYLNPVNHFPTGITYTKQRRDEIMRICQKLHIPVIENDMSRDIWRKEPPPPFKASDKYEQIIYIGSFSTMSLSGLQLVWVVIPQTLVERIADISSQLSGPQNNIDGLLAYIILKEGLYDANIRRMRSLLPAWIDEVDAALHRNLDGLATWDKDNINYHLWLKLDDRIDTQRLLMDCPGYFFLPGVIYTHKHSPYILLNSLGNPVEVLEQGFKNIADAAKAQLGTA